MKRILVDTNVFLRISDPNSAEHRACTDALVRLDNAGIETVVCAQVLIEFRAVATRLAGVNGLGMTAAQAEEATRDILLQSECLSEPPDVAARWRDLVNRYQVLGMPCHDTRLVAVALAHGVGHVLTMNVSDFRRYQEIIVLSPENILASGDLSEIP